MEKRGMQHVEFIVAFVLFAGFLIFALYFFSPIRGDRVVDSTLFYTMDEIAKNVSTVLETFSVSLNPTVVDEKIAIPLARENVGIRVEDSTGNELEAQITPGEVHVNRGSQRFFVIMFSEEFDNGEVEDAIRLNEKNYSISSSDKRDVLSEKEFNELVVKYGTDEGYQKLKEDFHLSKRANFGFSLIFSDKKIEAQRNVPEGLEVFSDSKRYEVVRKNSNGFADLEVRVW